MRRWPTATLIAVLAVTACSDASTGRDPSPDTSEALPAPSSTDPAFVSSERCQPVVEVYRNRAIELFDEPGPVDVVEETLGREVALFEAIAESDLADDAPRIDDAAAILAVAKTRTIERWDATGGQLISEIERSTLGYLNTVLAEPVVIGDRTIGTADAIGVVEVVTDQLLLACSTPPEGWSDLADPGPPPTAPDLFVVAARNGGWSRIDLAERRVGPVVADDLVSIEPGPDGRLIGASWPDRALVTVDPGTWRTTPFDAAGLGWACPSWTTDGARVVGDLLDETGQRRPVLFEPDGGDEPIPLPTPMAACPKSIGLDEVAYTDDDAVVAVTLDGDSRTLLALDRCNLVPITRARGGVLDVYANCDNPYLDGLHLLDVNSGESVLHIAGRVGAGALSPDGRWRVFVYGTHDVAPVDVELWLRNEETGQVGPIGVAPHYFPVFVPLG